MANLALVGTPTTQRKLPDLIDGLMEATDGLPTWPQYRLWSAISTVAGACERRVFVRNLSHAPPIYPNIFVALIGPPGNGKTFAVKTALSVWKSTRILKTAPDKMTGPALIDVVNAANRTITQDKKFLRYHSVQMAITEMSSLIPVYDGQLLGIMNKLYDNEDIDEWLRTRQPVAHIEIPECQATFIAGGQPEYLAATMPPHAWGQGFLSRFMFVWGDKQENTKGIESEEEAAAAPQNATMTLCEADIKSLTSLQGQCKWTAEARIAANAWLAEGMNPVPDHPKLNHYCSRRWIHACKLAMISCISRGNTLLIEVQDFNRALSWLFAMEKEVHNIFSQMHLSGDGALLRDAWLYAWDLMARNKLKAVPEHRIIQFLAQRIGANNVTNAVKNMEMSGYIITGPGDQRPGFKSYIPQPKEKWDNAQTR